MRKSNKIDGCDCEGFQAYAENVQPERQRRRWFVLGCCGQCAVAAGLAFCPWCGKRLPGTDPVPDVPRPPSAEGDDR